MLNRHDVGGLQHRLLHDEVPVSFSTGSSVAFASEEALMVRVDASDASDIGNVMRRRIQLNYALDSDHNVTLFTSDSSEAHLHRLWSWIQRTNFKFSRFLRHSQASNQIRASRRRLTLTSRSSLRTRRVAGASLAFWPAFCPQQRALRNP